MLHDETFQCSMSDSGRVADALKMFEMFEMDLGKAGRPGHNYASK